VILEYNAATINIGDVGGAGIGHRQEYRPTSIIDDGRTAGRTAVEKRGVAAVAYGHRAGAIGAEEYRRPAVDDRGDA
jgi:hypothetical protein